MRHVHPEHQLAWAASGVLSVTTAEGGWVLPPTRALWIPARTVHAIRIDSDVEMRSLDLDLLCQLHRSPH